MEKLNHDEVARAIAQLERELGRNFKVVNLTRPLAEIEAEIADEHERKFVRYEKEHGARIALLLKRAEV